MGLTTDPEDPRLGHGVDREPVPQNEVYLVLSEEERARGFVRPVYSRYKHVGPPGPEWLLRDLTLEEITRYCECGYVKYEEYPPGSAALGRFWTQAQLSAVGTGCGAVTTMGQALSETYARDPGFYGSTYCCHCRRHLRVGKQGEFTWIDDHGQDTGILVGT